MIAMILLGLNSPKNVLNDDMNRRENVSLPFYFSVDMLFTFIMMIIVMNNLRLTKVPIISELFF